MYLKDRNDHAYTTHDSPRVLAPKVTVSLSPISEGVSLRSISEGVSLRCIMSGPEETRIYEMMCALAEAGEANGTVC